MKTYLAILLLFSFTAFAQTYPEREALPFIYQLAKPVADLSQLKPGKTQECVAYATLGGKVFTSSTYTMYYQNVETIATIRLYSYYNPGNPFPAVTVIGGVEDTLYELGSDNLPPEVHDATAFSFRVRITGSGAVILYRIMEQAEKQSTEYIYCLVK